MNLNNNSRNIILKIGATVLLFAIFIIYFYQNNPSDEGSSFLRCPSNLLFNINCPGCGTQRAIHHILHLEMIDALRFNALFVLSSPIILAVILIMIYNFIFNKSVQIPIISNKYILISILIIIIGFGVLRNISIYPFTLLSP